MGEAPVTFGRAISVAWLVLWRGAVGGMISGALLGFCLGLIMSLSGFALQDIRMIVGLLGAACGLVWWIVVVRMALIKKYQSFRIVLISR